MRASDLLVCLFPEEIVGLVVHERLLADICQRVTARLRWVSSNGVHPLDELGRRQSGSTSWSVQVSDDRGEPYGRNITILEKQTTQRVLQVLAQTQKAVLSAGVGKTKTTSAEVSPPQ